MGREKTNQFVKTEQRKHGEANPLKENWEKERKNRVGKINYAIRTKGDLRHFGA